VFNLSGSEIVFILLAALVLLGPEKLPETLRKVGRVYAEVRKISNGFQSELRNVLDEPTREIRNVFEEPTRELRNTAEQAKAAFSKDNLTSTLTGAGAAKPAAEPAPATETPPATPVADDEPAAAEATASIVEPVATDGVGVDVGSPEGVIVPVVPTAPGPAEPDDEATPRAEIDETPA
jgi:sec-independent protein translocase protein TatB